MLSRANALARVVARPSLAPSSRPAPIIPRARRRTEGVAASAARGGGGGGGNGNASEAAAASKQRAASAASSDADGQPPIPNPSVVLPPTSAPFPDVDRRERALLYLTDAEADERVDAAAGLLSVLDDLRPLDKSAWSASEHVWRAIAEIPPTDRARLLGALDAGGCRQMWRHTVGRYALPRERAEKAFRGYTVWRDLPDDPARLDGGDEDDEEAAWEEGEEKEEEQEQEMELSGGGGGKGRAPAPADRRKQEQEQTIATQTRQRGSRRRKQVVEFEGVCERLVVESAPVRAQRPGDKAPIDLPPPTSAAADLRPRPGRALRRVRRFRFQLFRHARTGQPYARVVLPSAASSALSLPGLDLAGPSCYCRLDFGLALTPVRRDAGAELTLSWPSQEDPDLGGLTKADLPSGLGWPAPVRWSEDWKRVRRGFGGGWWKALTGGEGGGGEAEEEEREEEADGAEAGAAGGGGGAGAGAGGSGSAAEGWSPFSWTDRDYVRPAGPGVYVGCGYRPTQGLLVEDEFVWFALAKKVDADDFDSDDDDDDEDEEGA